MTDNKIPLAPPISVLQTARVWHVGDVVYKLRLRKDWTISELADKAQLSGQTVAAFEHDPAKASAKTASLLATALGTTVAALHALVPASSSPADQVRQTTDVHLDRQGVRDGASIGVFTGKSVSPEEIRRVLHYLVAAVDRRGARGKNQPATKATSPRGSAHHKARR